MLVQKGEPSARRAVHMVFTGEKVRPEYPEAEEFDSYRSKIWSE
jgi:hypothetical protein